MVKCATCNKELGIKPSRIYSGRRFFNYGTTNAIYFFCSDQCETTFDTEHLNQLSDKPGDEQ